MMDPKYRDLFKFPPARGSSRGTQPPRPPVQQPKFNEQPLPPPPPPPGLYITDKPEEADRSLCFVDAVEREKNIMVLDKHRIVDEKHDADMIVVITEDEATADICITREKCPPKLFDYV